MSYDDFYTAVQFTATVSLLMVAVLNLWRWWSIRDGGDRTLQPVMLLIMAALFAVLGLKQGIWSLRGALHAAGIGGVTIISDPSQAALVLNIATVLLCLTVYVVVSKKEGHNTLPMTLGAFGALVVTAIILGGYNG